jgi:hypothetical protein
MRFAIAVHAQGRSMRSHLPQQSTIDEKSQVVVDRGERNRWNASPYRGVNALWRMVPVGSNDGFVDHLALVRDRQPMLRRQLTELFRAKTHIYWIRISIKHSEQCRRKNLHLLEESQLKERTLRTTWLRFAFTRWQTASGFGEMPLGLVYRSGSHPPAFFGRRMRPCLGRPRHGWAPAGRTKRNAAALQVVLEHSRDCDVRSHTWAIEHSQDMGFALRPRRINALASQHSRVWQFVCPLLRA